jgi:hypothetical protein
MHRTQKVYRCIILCCYYHEDPAITASIKFALACNKEDNIQRSKMIAFPLSYAYKTSIVIILHSFPLLANIQNTLLR